MAVKYTFNAVTRPEFVIERENRVIDYVKGFADDFEKETLVTTTTLFWLLANLEVGLVGGNSHFFNLANLRDSSFFRDVQKLLG